MKGIRKRLAITVICATALVLVSAVCSPRLVAAQSSETYAIRNARIVTVTGPVIENGTVVISNGKMVCSVPAAALPSNLFSIMFLLSVQSVPS